MCGRFTLTTPSAEIAAAFGPLLGEPSPPRYNIAPTQEVAVIRQVERGRLLEPMRWGLIPSWAKEARGGPSLINARADTVAEKPAFRSAFKSRRCLVPADGFFEWRKVGTKKQPVYFRMRDGHVFAFAGLWEQWRGADGDTIHSFTLITTEPNDLVATVHDRMPVIMPAEAYELWLSPSERDPARLQPLLRPYPAEAMTAYPVSTRVNKPIDDDPGLIEPVGQPGLFD